MVEKINELLRAENIDGEEKYALVKTRNAIKKKNVGLKPLKFSDALFIAARDQCNDGTENGITSNVGSDGSFPF